MDRSPPPPVRAATAADEAALYQVWRRSVDATHGFIASADLDYYGDLFRTVYVPNRPIWVQPGQDDVPLGLMGMTGPKIDALFVDATHLRRGIGSALLAHALSLHPQLLVDVNEANLPALAFYTGHGFRRIGHSPVDHCGKPYPLVHMARL